MEHAHGNNELVLPTELIGLKRFHGHLGPYVVLGYRMGEMARRAYPKKIFATVFSGTQRPRSCLADGVQFSACCTLGKNNIAVEEAGEARAMFTDGIEAFEVRTLPEVVEYIDRHMTHETEEALSLEMFLRKEETLFTKRAVTTTEAWHRR